MTISNGTIASGPPANFFPQEMQLFLFNDTCESQQITNGWSLCRAAVNGL